MSFFLLEVFAMKRMAYRAFAGLAFCAFTSVIFTSLAVSEQWVGMPEMLTPRADFGAVLIDGKIYVFGGMTDADNPTTHRSETIESYDLATKTWTKESIMVRARWGLTVSAVDGKIYGIGGLRATYVATYSIVQIYDTVTKKWSSGEDMPTPRYAFSSSMVDGKIYAIGGLIDDGAGGYESTFILEIYDPATDTWTEKDSMPTKRYGLSTSVVNGKIYAIGGIAADGEMPLATVEMYDPVTDRWTRKADMLTARYGLGTSVADGKIYAIGGYGIGSVPLATVEMYNPVTDTWVEKKSMPTARGDLSTIAVAGRIYAIGGVNINGDVISTMEEYTPEGWPFSVSPRGKLTATWGDLKKSW